MFFHKKLTLFFLFFVASIPSFANVNQHFEAIKSNPKALYAFFKDMPKGGELHYHLEGGAYPETLLSLAARNNYCIDQTTSTISKTSVACQGNLTKELLTNQQLYQQTLKAWSMEGFDAHQESAHDHFYATFFKFMPAAVDFFPELLASVMQRAAEQHELYLEVMLLVDNARSATFANQLHATHSLADKRNRLLANTTFQNNIQFTVEETNRILIKTHQHLNCDTLASPACGVTVKFQYYILREQPLDNVFAQALNAFEAANRSKDIVGINLVQAEDGKISLRDYKAQMAIINFMHQTYPQVHIALHAGELTPQLADKKALRSHIHDALFTGHAERIGHGVDILHEQKSDLILNYMTQNAVAVEINLTSNQSILQVDEHQHPLPVYLTNKVPVVLSTDDEGILRTSLTQQYVDAVQKYALDYATIKTINRNALTYSFLPGNSIWRDPRLGIKISACQNLQDASCKKFIQSSHKAQLQWQLEQQLMEFENQAFPDNA